MAQGAIFDRWPSRGRQIVPRANCRGHGGLKTTGVTASLILVVGIVATIPPTTPDLFPANFLGRHTHLLLGSRDAEMLKLLAGLQRRCKPSRFQPASRPSFRGICRVTVFRSNRARSPPRPPFTRIPFV